MGYRQAAKMDRSPMVELRALHRPCLRSILYCAQKINVIIFRSHTVLTFIGVCYVGSQRGTISPIEAHRSNKRVRMSRSQRRDTRLLKSVSRDTRDKSSAESRHRLRNQCHVPAGHVEYQRWWCLLTPEFRYIKVIVKIA